MSTASEPLSGPLVPAPGIYHIAVGLIDSTFRDLLLTRHDKNGVTILPPGLQPDPKQEWRIIPDEAGHIVIEVPSEFFPAYALAYDGEPGNPKEGEKIVISLNPPEYKWCLGLAPGRYNTIQVAGSELGIRVSPVLPEPPVLQLGLQDLLPWRFERLRGE